MVVDNDLVCNITTKLNVQGKKKQEQKHIYNLLYDANRTHLFTGFISSF
jgi:hypothetical protein